jgi:predicted NACHT family NTPase
LLDGLDEVALNQRQACVEVINQFRRGHGLLPIAVCSRIADYDAVGTKLRLRNAVVVQPLTRSQIQDYLNRFEEASQGKCCVFRLDAQLGPGLEAADF